MARTRYYLLLLIALSSTASPVVAAMLGLRVVEVVLALLAMCVATAPTLLLEFRAPEHRESPRVSMAAPHHGEAARKAVEYGGEASQGPSLLTGVQAPAAVGTMLLEEAVEA